ncbi:MAG: ribosome small subunit-dependent GTPase A [Rhodothermales bacterium]
MSDTEEYRDGRVLRSTGSWYDVETPEGVVPSKVRGKFRLEDTRQTNPAVVGDRVTIRMVEDDTGMITEIHPRDNQLVRRAAGRRVGMEHVLAANIDHAWVVQSVRKPKINTGFVDRFLVMCEAFEIPAGLVINKIDLMRPADEDIVLEICDLYADLGYPVLPVSAETGENVDVLADVLKDSVSVLAGGSGVGKSTLLNAIEPGLQLRTGRISESTQKGKHTTTFASLVPLSEGGYVVDTPGVREYGLVAIEPYELGHYFPEFRPYLHDCRFPTCTHDHEPGCAVVDALEQDLIDPVRYGSYLNMLHSVQAGDADVGR